MGLELELVFPLVLVSLSALELQSVLVWEVVSLSGLELASGLELVWGLVLGLVLGSVLVSVLGLVWGLESVSALELALELALVWALGSLLSWHLRCSNRPNYLQRCKHELDRNIEWRQQVRCWRR